MKKTATLSIALLTSLGLAGCGTATHHHTTTHHSELHSSSNKSSSSSRNMSSSSSSSNQKVTPTTTNQQTSIQTNQQQAQTASAANLHDFVNRYGMSPAEYKVEHEGMTPQQALDATPNNMKTAGEIQLQHSMEKGN
ncbi:hypothetical protein ACI3E1_00745 [Ligilactobacillus sp. LYQ139]|uniref:hypothetical protein n=1 Tax=Ligilactobacillus sp. LYQ139 TaxID=3378800 RepID=UPI0038539992